jgi:orotate phosphoribosyltransferase
MSARDHAALVADAVTATLDQLPADVLAGLAAHGITVAALAQAIGKNAAAAIPWPSEEES